MVLTYLRPNIFSIGSNRGCLTHFARSPIKEYLKFIATIQVLGSTLKVANAPSLQDLDNIVSVGRWSNH